MKRNLFDFSKELAKEPIIITWENYSLPPYYKVDRAKLEAILPREQRVANAFINTKEASDKAIMKAAVRFASVNSKHVGKRSIGLNFIEQEGVNYAYLNGEQITISLSSFCDHRIPLTVRFNIVCGLILHELFHCRFTTPEVGEMLRKRNFTTTSLSSKGKMIQTPDFSKAKELFPTSLFKDLLNIFEDPRIETHGLKHYPGYVFFFDDLYKYSSWRRKNQLLCFVEEDKKEQDASLSFAFNNEDKLKQDALLFDFILYKHLLPDLVPDFLEKYKDEITSDLQFKMDRVSNWLNNSRIDTFVDAYELTSRVYTLFSTEYAQNHKPQNGLFSPNELELDPELLELLKKLLKEIACELKEEDKTLNKDRTVKLEPKLHKPYSYKQIDILQAPRGVFNAEIYNEARKISQGLKINLAFLDSRFNRTIEEYELLHGDIDEDMLYSLKLNNRELFCDEEVVEGYSLDVAILVDESGSMGGGKIVEAKTAALALALAFQESKHIKLFVYGHTADTYESFERKEVILYKYLDPYDKATDISTLFGIKARSNNADSYAIEQMGKILTRKVGTRNKVLIVISDGQPAARCYGNDDDGITATAAAVKKLEREGVFVIQIAIDNIRDSEKMFQHFLPYTGEKLGQKLKQVLNKKLVQMSNFV